MKQAAKWIVPFILAAALLGGAGQAVAAPGDGAFRQAASWPMHRAGMYGDYNPRDAVRAGRALPLQEVLAIVRGQIGPARMRDAEIIDEGGRPVYLIRYLMRDGSIAIVAADAATGRVLNIRRGGR